MPIPPCLRGRRNNQQSPSDHSCCRTEQNRGERERPGLAGCGDACRQSSEDCQSVSASRDPCTWGCQSEGLAISLCTSGSAREAASMDRTRLRSGGSLGIAQGQPRKAGGKTKGGRARTNFGWLPFPVQSVVPVLRFLCIAIWNHLWFVLKPACLQSQPERAEADSQASRVATFWHPSSRIDDVARLVFVPVVRFAGCGIRDSDKTSAKKSGSVPLFHE